MIKLKEKPKRLLIIAISAIFTGLSVCFPNIFGPLEWISIAPAIIILISLCRGGAKLRHVYLYGLFYFEIYFAVCFHFFAYLYPMDFTGIDNFNSVLVIITATFGLSLLQAIGSALVFLAVGALTRLGIFERKPALMLAVIPALFTVSEYSQTFGWWGVPWGRLVLGQMYDLAIVNTASLFGSYFISALIVFVNTGIALAFIFRKERAFLAKGAAVLAITALSLNLFVGTFLYRAEQRDRELDKTVKVALIQSNFKSTDVFIPSPNEMLKTYCRLSEQAANEGAELILWPESSFPYDFRPDNYLGTAVSNFAKEHQVQIIVGAITYDGGALYNRMYLAHSDGTYDEITYDKRHLVPFGEYVPMREIITTVLPFLADISILGDDMTPGNTADLFEIENAGKAGAIICFDSIYETLAMDTVRAGAEFFVLGTNDSWFSDSAAIYMHNNQARLRSIEFGRDMARAAISGTSTFITSAGDLTVSTEPLTECYVIGEVGISNDTTLYTVIGNLFVHLCTLSVLCAFGYGIAIHHKKRRNERESKNAD